MPYAHTGEYGASIVQGPTKALYPGSTTGNVARRYLACTRGNRGISTTGVRASSAQAIATQCAGMYIHGLTCFLFFFTPLLQHTSVVLQTNRYDLGPHATLHAHHHLPAWPFYLSLARSL